MEFFCKAIGLSSARGRQLETAWRSRSRSAPSRSSASVLNALLLSLSKAMNIWMFHCLIIWTKQSSLLLPVWSILSCACHLLWLKEVQNGMSRTTLCCHSSTQQVAGFDWQFYDIVKSNKESDPRWCAANCTTQATGIPR